MFTYFPYAYIFALAPPFLEKPSIQRCASCCKPCDRLENSSLKTNDPRRPWCAIVLSDTRREAKVSISPSRLVRESRRSHGFT